MSAVPSSWKTRLHAPWTIIVTFLALKLFIHLAAISNYGWFRDELYFVVCGQRPSVGYVDQPPITPMLAAFGHWLYPSSPAGVRVFATLAGLTLIALALVETRRLGGGLFAQALVGLTLLTAPVLLSLNHTLSTSSLEALCWLGVLMTWRRAVASPGRRSLWILLGLLLGLGTLNRLSMVFLGAAIVAVILITRSRRSLRKPGPWFALAISCCLIAPFVIWQQQHGWPSLEQLQSGRETKNITATVFDILVGVWRGWHPINSVVAGVGAVGLLWSPRTAAMRNVGLVAALVFLVLLNMDAKPYYLSPLLPIFAIAGALSIEGWLRHRSARYALVGVLTVMGMLTLPFALPILPVDRYIDYAFAAGIGPSSSERKELGVLPQQYADMFGWPELVDSVTRAVESRPDIRQDNTVIFAANYGEASALTVLAPEALQLPPVYSGHNHWFLWGPPPPIVTMVITVGVTKNILEEHCPSLEELGRPHHPYAMPYETREPILLCSDMRRPLSALWPLVKHYD